MVRKFESLCNGIVDSKHIESLKNIEQQMTAGNMAAAYDLLQGWYCE
jgi:hypothetical protein